MGQRCLKTAAAAGELGQGCSEGGLKSDPSPVPLFRPQWGLKPGAASAEVVVVVLGGVLSSLLLPLPDPQFSGACALGLPSRSTTYCLYAN